MSKFTTTNYTEPCVVYHPKRKQFWQCGVWVDSKHDATIYPNIEEATLVCGLRNLHGTEVLDAHTVGV